MMAAAANDHHEIVEQLVVARADLNAKSKYGCALPLGPSGGVVAAPTVPIAPAPSGRFTALHWAAYQGCTKSAVPLLVGGADHTITDDDG